jgi:hypothetical protein
MKRLPGLAVAALFLLPVAAYAQTIQVPQAQNINTNDLIKVIPHGAPTVGDVYATPAQITGVPGYINEGVATSGNTYTFGNSTTSIFMQPAATLAAVTLTTAANPSDGQRECFLSTQTTTALTWNANTNQTINGAPTAGVANTPICVTYVAKTATWYRSP